jgi:hypothetical protein
VSTAATSASTVTSAFIEIGIEAVCLDGGMFLTEDFTG